jgi:flagellar hook-basal body complex protein FliE
MTSPIGSIVSYSGLPATGLGTDMSVGTTTDTTATQGAGGTSFATMLASSMDNLQGTQSKADNLAVQAATGDLKDVHDYMIASNEASLATQMTVTLKNKAVEAFNQIMGMPV